jgi:hypothetical protein
METIKSILFSHRQLDLNTRSDIDYLLLNGFLLVSILIMDNFYILLFIVLAILTGNKTIIRYTYIVCTFDSASLSAILLNFCLHIQYAQLNIEFILYVALKLIFTVQAQENIFLFFLLSSILILLNKDINALISFSTLYNDSFISRKLICDHLKTVFLFISENGDIVKYNRSAKDIFGDLDNKNLFDLIPIEKKNNIKRMIKVAIQKRIPEEDFNHNFPNFGYMNFMLSIKYVPLETTNNFLLCFDSHNLSAKKRSIVFKSYQHNFALQEKVEEKIFGKYVKKERISIKTCSVLLNYLYSQQETVAVTEMLVGQVLNRQENFDIKQEIANCIQIYSESFNGLYVTTKLECSILLIVNSDRAKHHLLIKAVLLFISSVVKSYSLIDIEIRDEKDLVKDLLNITYVFNFVSHNVKVEDLNQIFEKNLDDIDSIINIQKKLGITISMFNWLLLNLNGKSKEIRVSNEIVSIEFSIDFNVGKTNGKLPVYFTEIYNGNDFKWPNSIKKISRFPSDIVKTGSRLAVSCGSDVISDSIIDQID